MAPLWTALDAAAATGGRSLRDWKAEAVSIDSRRVRPGDLFVALEGPNRDGHAFVADALAKGAAAAVVREVPAGIEGLAPLLVVDDTMAALTALGRFARERSSARFVAVTGSVGKTGTKAALKEALAAYGPTFASAASHNNHWGVPLSLANMPCETRFAVLEMGMNHAGELSALTRLGRPHVALITAIAPAHLAHFDGTDGIARAKAEIVEGLEPGGVAVINRDTLHADILLDAARTRAAKVVTFGEDEAADIRILDHRLEAERSVIRLALPKGPLAFEIGLAGRHWVANAAGIVAVLEGLGLDPTPGVARLAGLRPEPGRGARAEIAWGDGSLALIDESYNANPTSMAAAIAVLGALPGRRIAVLGDMLELGPGAPAYHADLAPALEAAGVARVFTCGAMMRHLFERLPEGMRGGHAETAARLAEELTQALAPGDVVLVKGSQGSRMQSVVDAIRAGAPALVDEGS